MSAHAWNKATFVFEFAPDKWMGLESFQKDVTLLSQVATRLGMAEGRRSATFTVEAVRMDEDEVPWPVSDSKIGRWEEGQGL